MRKNLSIEGRKKFFCDACQRSTVLLTENISSRTSEWTQGRSRIYSKDFFIEIKCNPYEGTLCYFIIFSLLEHLWTTVPTCC